jgi:putative nucleotidyltransferase with HDIG domain
MKNKDSGQDIPKGTGAAPLDPLDPKLLRLMVNRVEELLPLPTVVNEILKIVNDPYASLDRLSKVILSDQAITAKILKMINSAFYSMPGRISTVSQAVPLLGLEKIKNLAMAISLSDGQSRWPGLPDISRKALWIHVQATAVATQMLASKIGYPVPEEALIAGMLHDVGKALWTEIFPERFSLALKETRQGKEPLEAEIQHLSVAHPILGAWLLRHWQMPEVLQLVIANHHDSLTAVKKSRDRTIRLTLCLALGNILAKLFNFGNGGNFRLREFSWQLLETLEMAPEDLQELILQFPQALHDFVTQLELRGFDSALISDHWLKLQQLLAKVDVIYLTCPGAEPSLGLIGLLCQALSKNYQICSWDELEKIPEPSTRKRVLLMETHQPEALIKNLHSRRWPKAGMILFKHIQGGATAPFAIDSLWVQPLGPEFILSEFNGALDGKSV